MFPKAALLLVVATVLGGCHVGSIPDPNIHGIGGAPEIMRRNLAEAHRTFDTRVANGEISQAQKDQMIKELASEFLKGIDLDTVARRQAWQYGDVLRQAGRWEDAEKMLMRAVDNPENESRRINDSIQLARIQAHLGKVDEAIATVRTTFDSEPHEKAPILLGVLYEVVPEALNHGKDKQVALLLHDAIRQYEQVIVDPATDHGIAFFAAYPSHLTNAWNEVLRILSRAGDDQTMRQMVVESEQSLKKIGTF